MRYMTGFAKMEKREGRNGVKNVIISKLYSMYFDNKLMKNFHGYSCDNSYKSQ